MKIDRFFPYGILTFSIASLIFGLYAFSRGGDFIAFKIIFLYVLISTFVFYWVIAKIYKELFGTIADLASKYENMERLLFDIRDGTKKFYKEKRRSLRIKSEMTAKITNGPAKGLIDILDISYEGALLRTAQRLSVGQFIHLDLHLRVFPQPAGITAKVIRVSESPEPEKGRAAFDVGVEFLEMSPLDRKRLIETVDLLKRSNQKK